MPDNEQGRNQVPVGEIGVGCQLVAFPSHFDTGPPSREEPWLWYLRRRARGAARKLVRFASLHLHRPGAARADSPPPATPVLASGDLVRVRPADYIRTTLDEKGGYRGCGFSRGMYQYCGRELRVARKVNRFFDEANWRMLKAQNIVLLEGVHCDGSGSVETRGCDRMCFYFWRTEWLEKIGAAPCPPDL